MEHTPFGISEFIGSPIGIGIGIIAAAWIAWLMSRVAEEVRWVHEYALPDDCVKPRGGFFPAITLVAVIVFSLVMSMLLGPEAIPKIAGIYASGDYVSFLSSPRFIIGSLGLLVEAYILLPLLVSVFQLGAADLPEVPPWLLEILLVLASLGTYVWQFFGLAGGPLGVILTLLASLAIVLFAAYSFWSGFPNSPIRSWFCRVLVPYHHSPLLWFLLSIPGCFQWVWVTAVRVWRRWFSFYWDVAVAIPTWVKQIIYVSRPVTRLVRVLVPTVPSWVPSWARKLGNFVLDLVDTIIEVVEYVVIAIVVFVLALAWMIIHVLVTCFILVVAVYATLVCVLWIPVALLFVAWLCFFWWLPLWGARLFFFN